MSGLVETAARESNGPMNTTKPDPDLPCHRPVCPVCERPFPREPSRNLKTLQRRLDHLRDVALPRALKEGRTDVSYLKAEILALEWAVVELGATVRGERTP